MGIADRRAALDGWLAGRHYAPKTILDTRTDLLRAERLAGAGVVLPEILRPAVRRLEAAAKDTGDAGLLAAYRLIEPHLPVRPVAPRLRGAAAGRVTHAREARGFEDAAWSALLDVLDVATDPASRCLRVMARTGLRVGDMIRLPRAAVLAARASGTLDLVLKGGKVARILLSGAPDEWAAFAAPFLASGADDVAHWVSPRCVRVLGAGGAYKRLRQTLRTTAEAAGITEDVWTHRIRRTVGVRAYRATEDTLAVRDLLHHANVATTLSYLSEARPDRVADLQQKIRGSL